MRVTTAYFIKHYGSLADRALAEPVTITKNGRDRLVVLSVEEYQRLKRCDRRKAVQRYGMARTSRRLSMPARAAR